MMPPSLTRRAFLRSSAASAFVLALDPRSLFAQQQPAISKNAIEQMRASGATVKIDTQALRGSVSALIGSGGNIAVVPGKDGKLCVDSGYATSQPQLTAALAALSADPLRHLINTHWHFDHTDGNEWMHAAGAVILAQENTRTRLSTTQEIKAFGVTFPPSPAGALPTETFAETKTIKLNGESIALKHYPPAHTDTDISVYFEHADVLHAGDTFFNGIYPFIDYSTGGSIDGMIHATTLNLAMAHESTIIIPGHGPIAKRADLAEYGDFLKDAREKVAALKKQGKSLDEVVAAAPLASYEPRWGKGFQNTAQFTGLVYQGV